jgi:hypothetical protein
MSNLHEMSRLLYCHDWDRIEHWATAIGQLADLTDGEISELQRLGMSRKSVTSGSRLRSGLRSALRVVSQAVGRLRGTTPPTLQGGLDRIGTGRTKVSR